MRLFSILDQHSNKPQARKLNSECVCVCVYLVDRHAMYF